MELLNNLWIAISTPNENLMSLLSIPLTFIEAYFLMILFLAILNISSDLKHRTLYVTLMSLSSIFSMHFIAEPYNIFLNYFIMFILIYYIFKLSIFKSIIAIVSSALIFALIGTLTLNPFLTLFNITIEESSIIPIYRIFYLFIIYLLIYLIIQIFKYNNIKFSNIDSIDKRNKLIILGNLLLGLITLLIQSIITIYYIYTLPILITFLNFISLLAYFSISIYSLNRVTKLMHATQQLESAEEYNKTLQILHDNVRCFKHDFDNIVTTIGGYIKTDDMKGLKKYYERLEDDCQKVNNLYILNPEIINNNGIYNLLTKKYYEAESKGIKINLTFLLDLSSLKMQIYDFAKVLGILLDNAIEASVECDEKIINVIFRNDNKNNKQLLIIENTYNNKSINIDKIFEKGVSGKENHSGLGLWEIRQILKKNNNLNLHTSKTDKYFTQQFEIY